MIVKKCAQIHGNSECRYRESKRKRERSSTVDGQVPLLYSWGQCAGWQNQDLLSTNADVEHLAQYIYTKKTSPPAIA
jgi:hypothetical protein